jgi:hypothetical protein
VIRFRAEILPEAWRSSAKPSSGTSSAAPWPQDEDGIHFRVLSRFPYSVRDDLTGSMVTVLAISHHRRLPGYWRARGDAPGGGSGGKGTD